MRSPASTLKPAWFNSVISLLRAEINRSNGAPCTIWRYKLPDEPNTSLGAGSKVKRSYSTASSRNKNCNEEAEATVTPLPFANAGSDNARNNKIKRIDFMTIYVTAATPQAYHNHATRNQKLFQLLLFSQGTAESDNAPRHPPHSVATHQKMNGQS